MMMHAAPTPQHNMKLGVMSQDDLLAWLRSVRRLLIEFREEHHDHSWWQTIGDRLLQDGFTYEQSLLAEAYLFKGNRYGRKSTLYADFFPSREQAEAASIEVVPREYVARIIMNERASMAAQIEASVRERLLRDINEDRKAFLDAAKQHYELTHARAELAEASMKLEEANRRIDFLERQIRESRAWKADMRKNIERAQSTITQLRAELRKHTTTTTEEPEQHEPA